MDGIDKLAKALSLAQGEIKAAKKDAENPFFRSFYADLASVVAAAKEPLKNNELSVCQVPDIVDGNLVLRSILMHSSGQAIEGKMPLNITEKTTPQQLGSMLSYYRRYAYSAMVGVTAEDDDGNEASKTPLQSPVAKWAQTDPSLDKVKADTTEFVRAVEMCESIGELNLLVEKNAPLLTQLKKLPDWLSRTQNKIAQCREAFELS